MRPVLSCLAPFAALAPLAVMGCAASAMQPAGGDLPPAWSATPQKVWPTGGYTEGPAFDGEGSLYVSFPRSGRIEKMTADGRQSVWLEGDVGANGHLVLPDGNHLVATRPEVVLLSPEGEVLRSVSEYEGEPFVFPNDLALDGASGFYLTDSGSRTEATGAVYHVDADWRVTRVASGLGFANGIRLAPDGRTLYVSQSQDNDVLAYDVEAPGLVSNGRVLVRFETEGLDQASNAPDGMCLDEAGRLYVTHNGMGRVRVVSPGGEVLTSYRTGLLASSNCAFGPDGALYVTGSDLFETGPGGVTRLEIGSAR